jgi:hypothetical protein
MTSIRHRIARLLVGTMVAFVTTEQVVCAQDDDETEGTVKVMTGKELRQALNERERVKVRVLDSSRSGPEATTRRALEKRLASRLDELQVTCQLTEGQRNKLQLAGRGDIKRFTDQLDFALKKHMNAGAGEIGELRREMRELERIQERLFDAGSFFSKTVLTTLSRRQLAQNDKCLRDSNFVRYREAVTIAIRQLGRIVNMNNKQCEELSRLILTETQPPRRFGQSDYAFVMFQASRLPETKLREIVDDEHWKTLSGQLASWADSAGFLKSVGFEFNDRPPWPSAPVDEPDLSKAKSGN